MKIDDKNNSRFARRKGSALILVVVLTVLLSAVGILFVMMSRVNEMATSSISQKGELDAGVDAVVSKIEEVLLAGMDGTSVHPNDYPWLGSVEPVLVDDNGTPFDPDDDIYEWPYITDLYGDLGILASGSWCDPEDEDDATQWEAGAWGIFGVKDGNLRAKVISPNERTWVVLEGADADKSKWTSNDTFIYGARADADGDGVADSRWVRVPNISGGKSENIYAAVRVVDNNAKLNLNTAHSFSADPNNSGRYLSQIDYESFLRGADDTDPGDISGVVDNIRVARSTDGSVGTPAKYHDEALMNIENPGGAYNLFDIGDELEIANRFLLSSQTQARFESYDVAHYTFDAFGGIYSALEVPVDSADTFDKWKWRMDSRNFSVGPEDTLEPGVDPNCPEPYKYDRRHVCTFYSFDQVLRRAYPFVGIAANTVDVSREHKALTPERVGGDVFMPLYGPASVRDLVMVKPDDTTTDDEDAVKRSRKTVLHLLYACRAYFIDQGDDLETAAKRSAQYVANMIDNIDQNEVAEANRLEGPFYDATKYGQQKNEDPTYIDREIVRQLILEVSEDVLGAGNEIDIDNAADEKYDFGLDISDPDQIVYGYEMQPFISELYIVSDGTDVTDVQLELINPYDSPINLDGWRISIGSFDFDISIATMPGSMEIEAATDTALGRMVIDLNGGEGDVLHGDNIVEFKRPDPANAGEYIVVDRTTEDQRDALNTLSAAAGTYSSRRDDTKWRFTNIGLGAGAYVTDSNTKLNQANGVDIDQNGFQIPVADNGVSLMTLLGLEKVLFIGSDPADSGDPNSSGVPITEHIANASDESDIRFDIAGSPELLQYVSLLSRPMGNLPGRININTATKEVIRAAIVPDALWDADALADAIVSYRQSNGPFENIGDLLDVEGFKAFVDDDPETDLIDDDSEIEDDFEERDWILSRVANIFTVRSDVFTAYILVRLGEDGPERRVIAIFDRSNVHKPDDKPKILAVHPVPDPR